MTGAGLASQLDRSCVVEASAGAGNKLCEYLPVCGPYEEERVAAKSQAELKALKEVRSWR